MRICVFLAAVVAGACAGLLSLAPAGCGSAGSARFAFEARAAGIERDGAQPFTFTNEGGWAITLTKAEVTIGPVFLNVIAPLHDDTSSFLGLGLRRAFADDDHLGAGREVGEVLGQVTFDALSPAFTAFPVTGAMTQEQIRSAEIWFWPPPGTSPETLDLATPAVDLAGEAVRGTTTIRFRGALVLDDAWTSDAKPGERSAQPVTSLRKVRGLPFSFYPTAGGALEIRFDARALLRGADFSSLAGNPSDHDGTKVLVQSKTGKFTTDQVMKNLFQGLRASTGTYALRWSNSRGDGP